MFRLPVIIMFLLFTSCSVDLLTQTKVKVSEGQCFLEVDKRYTWNKSISKNVYKVDSVDFKKNTFTVTMYKNDDTSHYMGTKKYNYFNEGKYFAYKQTTCPGETKAVGITGKIKNLAL